MKTESSSKDTDVDRLIKGFLDPEAGQTSISKEKFAARRHIEFPKELFIELKLKKKDVLKVKRWEKAGHSVIPMWYCTCERVLFLDQEAFEEWTRKKEGA